MVSENASLEPRWREWLRCVLRDAVPCLNSSASWPDVSAETCNTCSRNVAMLILLGQKEARGLNMHPNHWYGVRWLEHFSS